MPPSPLTLPRHEDLNLLSLATLEPDTHVHTVLGWAGLGWCYPA